MIGLGLDAVDTRRFRQVLERRPGLVGRMFTAAERADVARRADPIPGLAARFAAKEAAMKALGVGLGGFALSDVEVVRGPGGAPGLVARGQAARLAESLGVTTWHVSLTHTHELAAAIVVVR